MPYTDILTNKNLKSLLKKKFTDETLMEIKTSFFIHPCIETGDNLYQFTYNDYLDGEVIYLFTSLEEYNIKNHTPKCWYLSSFKDSFFDNTYGVVINPDSDNVFIPKSLCLHIIEDMLEWDSITRFNSQIIDKRLYNEKFNDYFKDKSKITYYDKLFRVLNFIPLYNIAYSSDVTEYELLKKDNHIVVFTDKELIKKKDMCLVCDLIETVRIVLELDYEGILLITPHSEFTLPRHLLLRHFTKLIEKYYSLKKVDENEWL